MTVRLYTEADREPLLADLGPVARIECTPECLEESLRVSLGVWVIEGKRGISAICGVIAQTMMSDQCVAWLTCTEHCDARVVKRDMRMMQERFAVISVFIRDHPVATRFAEWLGFKRVRDLEGGYGLYELRRM